MAPAAMMAPCPGIRRGLEAMVPTVPGLVSEMVVPWKSAGVSLPVRARATRSSKAVTYCGKSSAPAFLMLGTIRLRAPSLPATSTAMPRLIWGWTMRKGWPFSFGVGVVEAGKVFEGLEHGPADEVRVGDLALAEQGAVLVDDAAVLVHHLDGDGALRGGQGNGHAGAHVLGDLGGDAAEGLGAFLGDLRGWGGRRGRGAWRRGDVASPVGHVLEDVLPAFVYSGAVVQILLIQLIFEPTIDTQIRVSFQGHNGEGLSLHHTVGWMGANNGPPCSISRRQGYRKATY